MMVEWKNFCLFLTTVFVYDLINNIAILVMLLNCHSFWKFLNIICKTHGAKTSQTYRVVLGY